MSVPVLSRRIRIFAVAAVLFLGVIAGSFAAWRPVKAAAFSMRTGYYVGSGVAGKTISGLGFQPNLVIIKASNTISNAVFRSSAMSAANTAFLSANSDNTATSITFTSTGFSLGTLANVNAANALYTYTAFSGSDCTSSGNFCVGTYTGTGAANLAVNTGFQPDMVIVKRSTAVAAHFRTTSMAASTSEYFTSTAAVTSGANITSLDATGFTVGTTDNVNAGVYYYVAFKSGSSVFAEGTYTGDGTDDRNITGVGFRPNTVFVKNTTSATANNRRGVYSGDHLNGDESLYMADGLVNAVNLVQATQSDGFQIGSGVNVNESATSNIWFAFGGAASMNAGSGTFTMGSGSYTGNGSGITVSSLTFAPDLVIIKDNAANYGVFRTSQMGGDATAYLGNPATDFTTGITSLTSTGFTVGTSTIVNTSANTYHWQAFGNAYNPDTNSGAADFAVGAYNGTTIDNKDIVAYPFQADLIVIKRNNTTGAAFKTSSMSGDVAGSLANSAETSNVIQSISSTGFQVGNAQSTNFLGSIYRYFAFKNGTNFNTGSYTGDGVNDRTVATPNFKPDLLWVKQSAANNGVIRPSTLAGDNSQFFLNVANDVGRIKSFVPTGFTLGTSADVNTAAGIYRYIAWREPPTGVLSASIVDSGGSAVATPNYSFGAVASTPLCAESTGTMGTSNQKIRISNQTGNANWSASIAATGGATSSWSNAGNTQHYDFNDITGSPVGCSDGGDADSYIGRLRLEPAGATLAAESGCLTTNVSLGSNQNFNQGTTDSITLASSTAGANTECYWDITDIALSQMIPASQVTDTYTLNFTITTVAQ